MYTTADLDSHWSPDGGQATFAVAHRDGSTERRPKAAAGDVTDFSAVVQQNGAGTHWCAAGGDQTDTPTFSATVKLF